MEDYFFHHEPMRSDRELFELENDHQQHLASSSGLDSVVAKEGMEILL